MKHLANHTQQAGISLVEVLVTVVIVAIGLLGLAGMQSRLQVSDMESYQRAQALLLLDDMAARISSNRAVAAQYITTSNGVGAGMTCPTTSSSSTRAPIMAPARLHRTAAERRLSGDSGLAGPAAVDESTGERDLRRKCIRFR